MKETTNDNKKELMKDVSRSWIEANYNKIVLIHNKIIECSGGEKGVRDSGGLYNSLYKIFKYQLKRITDPSSVGAFVYEELARRHHFSDGNKRTAHSYAKIVLFEMGFHLKVGYKEATPFIIKVAEYKSNVSFNEIKNWIQTHLVSIPEQEIEKYLKEIFVELTDES